MPRGPWLLSDNARMDSHEPDFIVVGEKVALGPLRRDLAAVYARWMNQLEVRRGLDQMGVATAESQEKWVEENLEKGAKREPDAVEFTVYDRTDSTPVGTAGLLEISMPTGRPNSPSSSVSAAARAWAPRPRGSCSTSHSTCCSCAMCCSRRWSGTSRADGLRAGGLSRVGPPRRGDQPRAADRPRDRDSPGSPARRGGTPDARVRKPGALITR